MCSVTITQSRIPASTASRRASFANGAGTKMQEAFAPVFSTASRTASKTGTPSTTVPAFPGVTPATTWLPNSFI